jgi:hypothetical protein
MIFSLSFCCLILILSSPFSLVNLAYAKVIPASVLLTSQSQPIFLDCNNFTMRSNLPGLTLNQSADVAVTDGNTSTAIGGQALFELTFRDEGIINNPGNDIFVYELTGVEPFNMSVFDSSMDEFTDAKSFSPKGTELKNSCGQKVNAASVDLSMFGIANGSSVSRLFVDNLGGSYVGNLGAAGCCNGSEISDIVLVEPSTEVESNVPADNQERELDTPVGLSFCLWLYSCE